MVGGRSDRIPENVRGYGAQMVLREAAYAKVMWSRTVQRPKRRWEEIRERLGARPRESLVRIWCLSQD